MRILRNAAGGGPLSIVRSTSPCLVVRARSSSPDRDGCSVARRWRNRSLAEMTPDLPLGADLRAHRRALRRRIAREVPGLRSAADSTDLHQTRQTSAVNLGGLAHLPPWYWDVLYVGSRIPGAVPRGELHKGANCQLWAYEVLGHFGFVVPDLRSDDLWFDTSATQHVENPEPLDLVLYKGDEEPYGAHVGLWTGDGVAHLCKEVGRPVVWPQFEFDARPRYACRIGFKRPILRVA